MVEWCACMLLRTLPFNEFVKRANQEKQTDHFLNPVSAAVNHTRNLWVTDYNPGFVSPMY